MIMMRNPNGYGSVTKLSGKHRNPFIFKKTKGWDDIGYPIYDIILHVKELMIALAEYNKNLMMLILKILLLQIYLRK